MKFLFNGIGFLMLYLLRRRRIQFLLNCNTPS